MLILIALELQGPYLRKGFVPKYNDKVVIEGLLRIQVVACYAARIIQFA